MTTKRVLLLVCISFILVFFSGLPHEARAAFGVSPPFINATHLVPGVKYVQTIYLVRDNADEDLPVSAKLNVPDRVRSWFSIDKGFDFVIPKGTRQFPIAVTVDVPKDAERVSYGGKLLIQSQPAAKGQVTIAIGANIDINLTVGNDIFEQYGVPSVTFLDMEEGWNPRIHIRFKNDGNVPESLSRATFEILDRFGGARLAWLEKTSGFSETEPFSTAEYTLEFPMSFHLGQGQYWAIATLYKGDKVLRAEKTIFNVLEPGAIGGPAAKIINYFKTNWLYYALGALVVVALGFVLYMKKRGSLT